MWKYRWSESSLKLHRVSFSPTSLKVLIHAQLVFILVVCANHPILVPKYSCEKFEHDFVRFPLVAYSRSLSSCEKSFWIPEDGQRLGWCVSRPEASQSLGSLIPTSNSGYLHTFRDCPSQISQRPSIPSYPTLVCLWSLSHHWPGHSILQ